MSVYLGRFVFIAVPSRSRIAIPSRYRRYLMNLEHRRDGLLSKAPLRDEGESSSMVCKIWREALRPERKVPEGGFIHMKRKALRNRRIN